MGARDFGVAVDSGAMCRLGNKIGRHWPFVESLPPSQSLVCYCCCDSFLCLYINILVGGRDGLGPFGVLGIEGRGIFVSFILF